MTITKEKKLSAIPHVVHDYVNLISAAHEMQPEARNTDIVRSHLTFSFIMAQRSLACFLSNKRKRDKDHKGDVDIVASDFGPAQSYDLREWRKWADHMNGHLFHLGYLRTRNSRSWNGHPEIMRMRDDFTLAWQEFFDGLQEPYKARFKAKIDEKRVAHSNLSLYSGS